MKSALNTMCFVALVLAVLGLGMIGAGFVWSGFDTDVFSTGIDHEHGVIVLGGDEVDPDIDLPLLSRLAEWGTFGLVPSMMPLRRAVSSAKVTERGRALLAGWTYY